MEERRITGLAVFFLGVGLLCFTFYLAYSAFMEPETMAPFRHLLPKMKEGPFSILKIVVYIIPVGLLWLMGSIGRRIVKAGLDMRSS